MNTINPKLETVTNTLPSVMATIKNKLTGETIILNAQNTFGRNQKNAITHIPDADVSQSHAIIFWKNAEWQLQDYSRNGTLVNG